MQNQIKYYQRVHIECDRNTRVFLQIPTNFSRIQNNILSMVSFFSCSLEFTDKPGCWMKLTVIPSFSDTRKKHTYPTRRKNTTTPRNPPYYTHHQSDKNTSITLTTQTNNTQAHAQKQTSDTQQTSTQTQTPLQNKT